MHNMASVYEGHSKSL